MKELNTIHHVCGLERTQLITKFAKSVQNPEIAGSLLTGNRNNILYEKGSTAWLQDCLRFCSPLHEADKCFDCMPIHYPYTVMYIDPSTTRQKVI